MTEKKVNNPRLQSNSRTNASIADITGRKQVKAALSKESMRLENIIEGAHVGTWEWNLQTGQTVFNEIWAEIIGYSLDELSPVSIKTWENLMHPDDLRLAKKLIEQHIAGELPIYDMEIRMRHKAGHWVWMQDRGKVVQWSGDGQPLMMFGTHTDITERKQAEEALQESEKKFRHLFEKAEEGILVARGEILEFANPALEKILGHPMDKITSEPFINFIHPDDQAAVLNRHLRRMQGGQLDRSYDFRIVTAEGLVKWVNISSQVIDWDKAPANLSFVSDITIRKQAEEQQARLMSAIEQSSEVIVITDNEGIIQYVNPAFEKTTGYSREEAVGENPRILKSGNQDDSFYQSLWSTITSGDTFNGRMVNKRKDGTLYTEYATVSPVVDATGRILNYVAVKRDITEQEKLQAQLHQAQKMESVGRLAGGVAHDFNNKLFIINGYAEMAMDMVDSLDPVRKTIQEILTAGKQSANIVRQLLAFASQQAIAPVQLDLNDIISSMLKMLQRLIGENIDLTWHPGKNLWPVKIDPSQVDQIMANLAVNARDAISDVGNLLIEKDL
jgi:PAS domain S-box-containing protein